MKPTSALIIVDVQNDFLPGGALAVSDGDAVIEPINQLARRFAYWSPRRIGTQRNHGSFAANHPPRKPGEMIDLSGPASSALAGALRARHQRRGIGGNAGTRPDPADFPERRRPATRQLQAGFFDNGHRRATGLGDYLKESGITDVFVAGLATDYCVKFTALDAVRLGFATHLVADTARGVELHPGDIAAALHEMQQAGVRSNHSAAVT